VGEIAGVYRDMVEEDVMGLAGGQLVTAVGGDRAASGMFGRLTQDEQSCRRSNVHRIAHKACLR